MRLLFVTIEFSAGTFSGNGVYAQSQVRALTALGHEVVVISGKPAGYAADPLPQGAVQLLEVELPVWGCLDHNCSWREFAEGARQPHIAQQVLAFGPDAVLGVDWSSVLVYQQLAGQGLAAPYVYMNYRVYTRTATGEARDLLLAMERQAVATAVLITALSRSDAAAICEHMQPRSQPQVLLPALRADMEQLPLPPDTAVLLASRAPDAAASQADSASKAEAEFRANRAYLSCCVRLSHEKEPDRFVEVVEHLAAKGVLQQLQVTPLLCASATSAYADGLKGRLRAAWPASVIEERFLGPAELAQIYAATRLNFHPCLYDAYGMTVVEAASQGAPSVVNQGGTVGATDLFSASHGEVCELDLNQGASRIAEQVAGLLQRPDMAQLGASAAKKARSWTEAANARRLVQLLAGIL